MKADVTRWLADAGLGNLPIEALVDGFARRLNELGVPLARMFVGTSTLHPLVRVRSLIWERDQGLNTRFEFRQSDIDAPMLRQSPFASMLQRSVAERRNIFTSPAPRDELPVFAELRAAGMTEWYGWVFPFGPLVPKAGDPLDAERRGELWLVCSLATDAPAGFTDSQMALVRDLLPVFALAAKATTLRTIGEGLLGAYLGRDPASRVLAGTVERGQVQGVEAVLLFTDLRGFTALADTMPGQELITLLDDCFDGMVRPVVAHGGEILKFLGDGLLAIFRVEGRSRAEVCGKALDAACETLAAMAALEARRAGRSLPTPALDVALHVGHVHYGNVGADDRLDFTVIGPAVNEASRIERLCDSLGRNLLMSQAFARAADTSRHRLVSLGYHRLRGVREDTELFGLVS
ncbi:adenylate/guanylate cyclase domain-containing protein [Reyranella sp.]|uniref:adenylate/guanylate cyclase domain-containing protein n=1 Tax=Reyranella sp. TaxID=1929291 RepID=UPI003BAD0A17